MQSVALSAKTKEKTKQEKCIYKTLQLERNRDLPTSSLRADQC